MPNDKLHTYIEKHRIIEESNCKWMKRNLVGMIRYMKEWSEENEILIPEEFFDDIPDNVGFSIDFAHDEDGEDLRVLNIVESWKTNEDDCGGTEEICNFEDVYFTGVEVPRKVHLKLIVNNENDKK